MIIRHANKNHTDNTQLNTARTDLCSIHHEMNPLPCARVEMQNKQKQQTCKNTVRLPMFSAVVEAGPDTVSDCKVMSTGCLERSGRRGEGGGRMKTTARPVLESEGGGGGGGDVTPGLEMDKASLIQTHKTSVLVSSSPNYKTDVHFNKAQPSFNSFKSVLHLFVRSLNIYVCVFLFK